jgi:hypothetical protein
LFSPPINTEEYFFSNYMTTIHYLTIWRFFFNWKIYYYWFNYCLWLNLYFENLLTQNIIFLKIWLFRLGFGFAMLLFSVSV